MDPAAFRWTDAGWRGLETADLVIYELHVGTFTPAGTFDGVIERLPALRELGVTAIEIMPVAEFPGSRNWGYDGVSLYAVQSTYGGPNGLKRLVDAAHRAGLAVLLDVVYNHLGPEGNYLGEFGPYFSDRYRTAWGQGFNLDGPDSDEVRRYLVDNAVYWVTRVPPRRAAPRRGGPHRGPEPACTSPRRSARRCTPQGEALGRRTLVIAEIDANDPRWVRGREVGGYGLDAHWSDDFHHAVHVALTGERDGLLRRLHRARRRRQGARRALRERRPLLAAPPPATRPARGGRAGRPVRGLRSRTTTRPAIAPAASGSPRWSSPEALRLAAALLLLSPYVPLLFMGEEHGETNPFLYFVSHGDPALVEAVREGPAARVRDVRLGRRDSRSAGGGDVRGLAAGVGAGGPPAMGPGMRALYRDLLRLRRTEPALRPGDAERAGPQRRCRRMGGGALRQGGSVLEAMFNLSLGAAGRAAGRTASLEARALHRRAGIRRHGGAGLRWR